MKNIKFSIALLLLVGFTSCDKDCPTEEEYLKFGWFYGECGGEGCVEIFELSRTELSEDTEDRYPSSLEMYGGSFEKLSDEKFQLAKDLLNEMPSELKAADSQVFGAPDAGDWGGIYVEYSSDGDGSTVWLLDQQNESNPAYARDFVDAINEIIVKINE